MSADTSGPPKRAKASHVGAPAVFSLEMACRHLNDAFGGQCYLVGSAIERPDWRDVDIRLMVDDEDFAKLFPDAGLHWERDARWLLIVTAVSAWLQKQTGLPIDFQIQPQTHANQHHKGARHPKGLVFQRSGSQT